MEEKKTGKVIVLFEVTIKDGKKADYLKRAEILMLHSMQRKDIFSYKDLAIHRGLKLIYHHKKIDKKLFDKYKKRFRPYGSIASIYIWAVAGGKIPNLEEVLE